MSKLLKINKLQTMINSFAGAKRMKFSRKVKRVGIKFSLLLLIRISLNLLKASLHKLSCRKV